MQGATPVHCLNFSSRHQRLLHHGHNTAVPTEPIHSQFVTTITQHTTHNITPQFHYGLCSI